MSFLCLSGKLIFAEGKIPNLPETKKHQLKTDAGFY
jgi:hypothetical protein